MSVSKKIQAIIPVFLSVFLFVPPAFAAVPDGVGPWADSVLSSSQGLMKNGSPVPAIRSNPNSALGVAENNTVDGNFFSLGFGGNIALGFENGISSGVIVVEATTPNYPAEKAKIEVSENGTTWVNAGEVTQDGSVNKPAGVNCAKFVRITDISDPTIMPDDVADGYDVDGVKATGDPCTPPATGGECCCGPVVVNQSNATNTNTTITSSSNTGKNTINNTVGGSNTVTTGNASNTTTVAVSGGNNTVISNQCCVNGKKPTNVTISGNGEGSKNTVILNQSSKKNKKSQKH